MLNLARKLWNHNRPSQVRALVSPRPLVLLQSDDWGRVGVRDQEGSELLQASGIGLGEQLYDFYTLETAEDVTALRGLLKRHHDSTGRSPCMVMNFVMANLDFAKIAERAGNQIHLLPLTQGLPGKWRRAGLFEAYRQGIGDGVFYPALHGLTHFCQRSVEQELSMGGERGALLRTLWKAETPYIHWRMPWVGFEYWQAEKPGANFLAVEEQTVLIRTASATFLAFFSQAPVSACAPGYRANHDTHLAWYKCGVRVAQNGLSMSLPPHMDESEMLNLYRTIDFEPSQRERPVEEYLRSAEESFARGVPFIISVHSINFHSSLKDFRGPTLKALDSLLSALEAKHPDLLYVHDGDLYEIVTQGRFTGEHGPVSVTIKQQDHPSSGLAGVG